MSLFLAVDLGVASERTALVVIESKTLPVLEIRQIEFENSISIEPVFLAPDGSEVTEHPPVTYSLRHAERLPAHASYPTIVSRLTELLGRLKTPTLVLDTTGVGEAALDLFDGLACGRYTVCLTGGEAVTQEFGRYRVPKREVVSTAQVLMQTRRLRIARGLPLGELLLRELQTFRMKVELRRTDDPALWREGPDDDLVLALSVGLWVAERHPGVPQGASFGKPVFDAPSWE